MRRKNIKSRKKENRIQKVMQVVLFFLNFPTSHLYQMSSSSSRLAEKTTGVSVRPEVQRLGQCDSCSWSIASRFTGLTHLTNKWWPSRKVIANFELESDQLSWQSVEHGLKKYMKKELKSSTQYWLCKLVAVLGAALLRRCKTLLKAESRGFQTFHNRQLWTSLATSGATTTTMQSKMLHAKSHW